MVLNKEKVPRPLKCLAVLISSTGYIVKPIKLILKWGDFIITTLETERDR
jgi:hypothetical protein